MSDDDRHVGRRAVIRGIQFTAVVALAGCLEADRSPGTPEGSPAETETSAGATTSPTSTTETEPDREPGTGSSPEDCPTGSPSKEVYVDDLVVQNTDDDEHVVALSITMGEETVFEERFDLAGSGGGQTVPGPIFDATGTYRLVVRIADEGTARPTDEPEASREIDVESASWRRFNGAVVSIRDSDEVEEAARVEITILHGDPDPTPTDCDD